MMKWHTALKTFMLICLLLTTCLSFGYDSSRLKEPIVIDGLEIVHPEFALFKLPGTKINITSASPIQLLGADNKIQDIDSLIVPSENDWFHYQLVNASTGETLKLHIFSLVPSSAINDKGYLDHFKIGHYPSSALNNRAIYLPPTGYIRVDREDFGIHLSPNFTVGQFLSKQADSFPKYLVLRPELIIKLERILKALNLEGHKTDSFHIMSGYRTPAYNKAIGNVVYSRHQWGGAADIFIDENPKDNFMDDLNRDGKTDKKDSIWLSTFIDKMSQRGEFKNLGGLGVYGSTSAHGPFVHVDVRGYRARW